jgi:hypothetical protein
VDGDYELLKTLGLIDDEEVEVIDGYDKIEADEDDDCDDDDEFEADDENDDDRDNYWNPSKMYTGWDYLAHFGEDAWNKLYQARLACHRNIVIREFTRRLPNISEQEKNGLFDAFSRSDAFGVIEHNALLDALANPVKGWNLNEY